jgi:hypothetical protein
LYGELGSSKFFYIISPINEKLGLFDVETDIEYNYMRKSKE